MKIQDYVGLPWQLHGRSFDGVDCLGLVILASRGLFGVDVPDLWEYSTEAESRAVSADADRYMLECGYREVKSPRDGDIALFRFNGFGHLSLYLKGRYLSIVAGQRSSFMGRRLPFRYFRPAGEKKVKLWV